MGQRNFKPIHKSVSVGRTLDSKKWGNLYDHAWEKYRARFLAINPRCYACGKESTVVDHITPHQGNVKLFKDLWNHIPLCTVCHNKITALFDRRYIAGNSVAPKIAYLQNLRFSKNLFFKVKPLGNYE